MSNVENTEPENPIRAQIRHVWVMMLRQATEAGMSREEIAKMALETSLVIVTVTADNLWPQEAEDPPGEAYMSIAYTSAMNALIDGVGRIGRAAPAIDSSAEDVPPAA